MPECYPPNDLQSSPDSATLQFRKRLLSWYALNRRQLPWRDTRDPYSIWVSEIMLQQTQVATVIEYYLRFLERFPDIRSLASADEQLVLTYWAGLGYYRRARQLHSAAKQIVTQHAGVFPRNFEYIRDLPGIGRYTAGAIASFAFGTRAPILEANTIRLFSRLTGLREDPKLSQSQTKLWEFAESILPQRGPNIGQINQATMELGSLVCLPRDPKCDRCPVATICSAFRLGLQKQIPLLSQKTPLESLTHVLVVIRRKSKVLMRQNMDEGWWAGLWDFPRVDISKLGWAFDAKNPNQSQYFPVVDEAMQQKLQLDCQAFQYLRTIKHGVTRYRITLVCFEAQLPAAFKLSREHKWRWVDTRLAANIPLTSTAEKLKSWLDQ